MKGFAGIITTGDEVVEGRITDTNAPHLGRLLAGRGHRLRFAISVGDDVDEIEAAIRAAVGRVETLAITGGLGGTADDVTREALARASCRPLVEHPEGRAVMERFWASLGRDPKADRDWVEARLPEGCSVIDNPRGLAPGIDLKAQIEGTPLRVLVFPGVPGEMRAMAENAVPWHEGVAVLEREFRVTGLGESVAAEMLGARLDRGREPRIGIAAKAGFLLLRVVARGARPEEAASVLEAEAEAFEEIFGARLVSADGREVEETVADALGRQEATLAVAESLTGGYIGHLLTELPGISRTLLGVDVTYSNEAKCRLLSVAESDISREGAVSETVARAMARGVRDLHGADWGIATTGIAGPTGGRPGKPVGLAWVAVAGPKGVVVAESRVHPGERSEVKQRAARHALDLLRRSLLGG